MKTKGSLRRITAETRNTIYEEALKDRVISRIVLAQKLEQKLGDKSPSLDTLEKLISSARNHPPSILDNPWSIGTSSKYDISAYVFPLLVDIRKVLGKEYPTIRESLWISRLYPILKRRIRTAFPNDEGKLQGYIYFIAQQYARYEQIAEIMKKPYPDTTSLDEIYFSGNGPLDINEGFISVTFGSDSLNFYRKLKGVKNERLHHKEEI